MVLKIFEFEFVKREEDGYDPRSEELDVLNLYERGGNRYLRGTELSKKLGAEEVCVAPNDHLNMVFPVAQFKLDPFPEKEDIPRVIHKAIEEYALRHLMERPPSPFHYEARILGTIEPFCRGKINLFDAQNKPRAKLA